MHAVWVISISISPAPTPQERYITNTISTCMPMFYTKWEDYTGQVMVRSRTSSLVINQDFPNHSITTQLDSSQPASKKTIFTHKPALLKISANSSLYFYPSEAITHKFQINSKRTLFPSPAGPCLLLSSKTHSLPAQTDDIYDSHILWISIIHPSIPSFATFKEWHSFSKILIFSLLPPILVWCV